MTTHPNSNPNVFKMDVEPTSIIETLAHHTERDPDRVALTILRDGEAIESESTFGDLYAGMMRVARGLAHLTEPGARVLLLLPTGAEFVCTFYGCLASGRVAVPAYHPQQVRKVAQWLKLQAIADNCGATLIVAPAASIDTLATLRESQQLFSGCKLVPYEALVDAGMPDESGLPHLPDASDLAFLQYTSGSTGTPKGVMITHGNIIDNQRAIATLMQHDRDTRMLSWLPLYHDMGLSMPLQLASIGLSVVLMSPVAFVQQPGRWLRAISAHRATTSGGPNFAYALAAAALNASDAGDTLDLSSWRVAFCGAEPIHRQTVTDFIDAACPHGFAPGSFYPCYGMAEATLIVSGVRCGEGAYYLDVDNVKLAAGVVEPVQPDHANVKSLVSCGATAPGTEIRIADADGRPVADPNGVGEIWVRGGAIGVGYYGNPDATQSTFGAHFEADPDARPFMRTGDLGAIVDGRLYVTGRVKDMLIVRGRNLYPQDIEACVQDAVPALRRGCGAAVSVHVDGEEKLVIIQEVGRTARRTMDLDATLRAMVVAVGEDFGVTPHAIVLVEPATIEKTSSGKIARALCRRAYLQGELRAVANWTDGAYASGAGASPDFAVAPVAPPAPPVVDSGATLIEREIAARIVRVVAERLKISEAQVSRTAAWVEMGFDSMSALQFSLKVQHAIGLTFDAAVLWDCSNVEQLAAHLARMQGAEDALRPSDAFAPAPARASGDEDAEVARTPEQLAALSDADAEALLLKELQR
ncbi:AMP-binding protein [Burkholderia pyrrocinia]|uniref:AMP-binding protein n=1 Tax=Burkholderia pyrrocinia TaxID=60550 RepID=UPI001BCCF14F|nr:AMP-binding protein [Burkholderia pyrrocinia]QVN23273.1 AMP-binding protein [Burkholderia pyrrocinia]